MKQSNNVRQLSSPKRRPAPPPRIPKPKSKLKHEAKISIPLESSVQFDQMEVEEIKPIASSDQIALNVDQSIPARRRSTLIEIAAEVAQSVVDYINRPYTPSPEVIAFLESLYLTEEERKEISTQELDQLINQSWYGRFLNGFASNHVFFKIFAWWYLDERGIKLHDLCEPHGDIEAIELDKITSWDKDIALKAKEADLLKEEKSDNFRSFQELQDIEQQNNKDSNKKNEQEEFTEVLIQQDTKSYFARRVWPKNRCLLFESQTILSRAYSVEEMTNQLRWFNKIWAMLLLSLLSNDIYFYYKYPERRYDNTLAKIILSKSKHSKMLSHSLTSVTVWPELVAFPLVLALYGATWKRYHPTHAIPQEAIVDIEKYWQTYQPNIKQDLLYPVLSLFMPGFLSKRLGLHPFPDPHYNFNNVSKTILWDGRVPAEDKIKLFEIAQVFLKQTSKLNKINLLTLFEELAENIHPRDTERLKKAGYDKATIKTLLHIQSKSLAILKAQSKWSTNGFIYALYAHFLLWNIGQPETTLLQPFFWGFQSYRWYATVNFFIVLTLGFQQIIEIYLAKKACEKEGKLWMYMDQVADYQCSVCGDLPIYYGHIFSNEKCIEDWFGKSRTAQELIAFAENRIGRVDFSQMRELDLYDQYLNGEYLARFLRALETRAVNLKTLDFSRMIRTPEIGNVPINATGLQSLTRFLKTVPVRTLNLRDQYLGDQEAQILGQGLNSSKLQTLYLINNNIGDIGAVALGAGLLGSNLITLDLTKNSIGDIGAEDLGRGLSGSGLRQLVLNGNNIGDEGAAGLGAGLPDSNLETLFLQYNSLGNNGTKWLGAGLPDSNLETLFLQYNNIGSDGAIELGLGLLGSKLRTLHLDGNNIGDEGAAGLGAGLSGSNLTTLSLMVNNIGDEGAMGLGAGLPGSNLKTLSLEYNNIGDEGAAGLGAGLPGSKLITLTLYANNIGAEGAAGLGAGLPDSKLITLTLYNNNIGDEGAAGLGEGLPDSKLITLTLYNNNIGDEGAAGLGAGLPDSNLETLSLLHNNIGSDGAIELGLGLLGSKLRTLNLDHNNIDAVGARGLIAGLPGSNLQTLYLNYNNIGSGDAKGLGTGLSGSNLTVLYLEHNAIGDESATGLGEGLPGSNLQTLGLNYNSISYEGMAGLCAGLPGSNLQELYLIYNGIGNGITSLKEALSSSNLRILDLRYNYINNDGAVHLGEGLPGSNLQTLYLDFNNIEDEGTAGLGAGLPGSNLKCLSLIYNKIGDAGAIGLGTELPGSKLQTLYLYHNEINADGAIGLGNGLPGSNLQMLSLKGNNVSSEGAIGLAHGLPNSNLQVLDLSFNNIGAEGAIGLGKGLSGSNLQWLILGQNNIGDNGMVGLKEGLPGSNLKRLDLYDTEIGDSGVMALAAGLPGSNLETLFLNSNNIGNRGAIAIANVLTTFSNKIVNTMWIQQLDPDIKRGLAQSHSNTNLKFLNLQHNELTDIGAHALCQVLPYSDIPIKNLSLIFNDKIKDLNLRDDCVISAASSLQLPLPFRLLNYLYRSIKQTIWLTRVHHHRISIEKIFTHTRESEENEVFKKDFEEKLYISETDETKLFNRYRSPLYLSHHRFEPERNFDSALSSFQSQNTANTIPSIVMFFVFGVMLLWIYKNLFNQPLQDKSICRQSRKTPKISTYQNNFWLSSQENADVQLMEKEERLSKCLTHE